MLIIMLLQVAMCLLLDQVCSAPSPRRYRGRGRGRGGYYRPYTQQATGSNYFNTVLPLKVAGGVGLAAGFGLSQVLGK